MMDKRRAKFLFLGLGIAATTIVVLALAIGSPGGMAYYMTVSEFAEGPPPEEDNLRVSGKVAAGTIERAPDGTRVRFVLTEGGANLPVRYEGTIPDAFDDDVDVVVEGTPAQDGTFEATLLLAKCPSKYEAAYEAGEPIPHTEIPVQP